jgi:hypothetical protein
MRPKQSGSHPAFLNQVLYGHIAPKGPGALSNFVHPRKQFFEIYLFLRGPISAATLPRRVILIRSPREARSTNSEPFSESAWN